MRYFDVDAAQRLIPVLTSTFTRIRSCVERIQELTRDLQQGDSAPSEITNPNEPGPAAEVLRAERDRLASEVQEEIVKLEVIGVEVKSLEGLVDFRAIRSGRTVYLCWQLGEPAVGYWHELDSGFSGRRPIENASAFEPSYLS
jgi:hypothetical protein